MDINYSKSLSDADEMVPVSELKGCNLGEELKMRLLTGIWDEERHINYDKYWSEKLACLDRRHTCEYNLHMDEIEKSITSISQHLNLGKKRDTLVNEKEVVECFDTLKAHQILKCHYEVEEFIQNVDKLMYKVVRPNLEKDLAQRKFTTYAELFNRS